MSGRSISIYSALRLACIVGDLLTNGSLLYFLRCLISRLVSGLVGEPPESVISVWALIGIIPSAVFESNILCLIGCKVL